MNKIAKGYRVEKRCADELIATKKPFRYKMVKICKICGKAFHPSRKEDEACSRKCGCVLRNGKSKTLPRKEIPCDYCGKKILRAEKKKYLKNKHHYCSNECYWSHKKYTQSGKNNTKWRGGKPIRICPTCGKNFSTYEKTRLFCSRACSYKTYNMTNLYAKGSRYEWDVRKKLIQAGYIVVRSAGSHSPFDLIATNSSEVIFIQCKRIKKMSKPIEREIENFRTIPVPPGCRKEFRIKLDFQLEKIIPC